jgi:hypothetical protein
MTDDPLNAAVRDHVLSAAVEMVRQLHVAFKVPYSDVDDLRKKYIDALGALSTFLEKVEAKPEVMLPFFDLGIALGDLRKGMIAPIFKTAKKSKQDSTVIWHARMFAAVGLECFIRSGMTRKAAAKIAAKDYPRLSTLFRGGPVRNREVRKLEDSIVSWYVQFEADDIKNQAIVDSRKQLRAGLDIPSLSSAELLKRGHDLFSLAVASPQSG